MSDKKIQHADPKAIQPAAGEASTVEDKTADRKAAGARYGRKSGRKTSSFRGI